MLSMIKDAFATKSRVRIIIRAALSANAQQSLQAQVRSFNVLGWMKVVQGSHVEIELESARPRLERLINFLRRQPIFAGASSIEVTWLPYQNRFQNFRVAL